MPRKLYHSTLGTVLFLACAAVVVAGLVLTFGFQVSFGATMVAAGGVGAVAVNYRYGERRQR